MKRLLIILAFGTGSAFAAGTAYYITSRVTIRGPSDWGVSAQNTLCGNTYAVSASNGPLANVVLGGDPEFRVDADACTGVRSCTATVSFLADVGGDYSATIRGTSSAVGRVHGSSTSHPITAHVVGANYTLTGVDNGDSTATFTLASTGEEDLVNPGFNATTWNDVGVAVVTGNTCDNTVPTGTSCQITVAFALPDEATAPYGYVLLQAYGNTRQQDPARVTLVLPLPAE